ncbi:MAG: D-alanyl-D-alanine carboxypeptidase, partial [Actinomycetota bacterium]
MTDPRAYGHPGASARARPRRRGGALAFTVLGVIALAPALGLLVLHRWADEQIPAADAAPAPSTTLVAPPIPPDPLPNAFATLRRLPAPLAFELNEARFRADVAGFLGTLNERSCVAVSVGGVDMGAQNPDVGVIPASNIKLVVAAVALDLLGPSHRFTTDVVAPNPPVGGVIDGDLALVGGGDPLLSSSWYPTSNLERQPVFNETSLDALADAVVAAGVTEVRGDVVGDGSRYDDEFFAPGWGPGVAGLEAGPYDALLVNDARVLGEEQRAADPNAGAAREFARLLRDRGVTIGGAPVAGVAPVDAATIASIDSVELGKVVEELLTNSDNNTAELLVKELGVEAGGAGTREAGLAVMSERLAAWGVDPTALVLADGSGLSLDNRLTCSALLDVLQRDEASGTIGSGLAVAGQTGTLADAFVDHPVAGRLRGKTGTLNNPPFNEDPPAVKALAGYVPIEGGGDVEYVLVLNGPTISDQSEYRP